MRVVGNDLKNSRDTYVGTVKYAARSCCSHHHPVTVEGGRGGGISAATTSGGLKTTKESAAKIRIWRGCSIFSL